MAVASHQIKPLQVWSGRLGHLFLVLASVVTGYAGWIWGNGDIIKGVVFAAFMGLTPWAVAYLLPFVSVARASGRTGTAYVMAFGVFIAGAMEWRAEMMVFAGQRNTSAIQATLQNTRLDDARKSVSILERQLENAQATLEKQLPYGTSASYESQIKNADDLAARESSKERSGCKAKCDQAKAVAADLRAKQAIAKDRETKTEPEVARLTRELSDAKAISSETKAGDSMSVAESEVLAAFWSGKLQPGKDAMKWTDMVMGAFMAVFLLVIPTMLVYNSKTDWDAPKYRNRNSMFARISAWMKGEKLETPEPVQAREAHSTRAIFTPVPPIEQRFYIEGSRSLIDAARAKMTAAA